MRRQADLFIVVACSLLLTAVILAVPSAGAARILLGLPFVLFFPGYTLVAALFPGKDDLDPIERVALSFGLSIAVVPLIGLALNYGPWGIRLTPILVALALFILLAAAVALARRRALRPDDAFSLALNIRPWLQASFPNKLFGLGVVTLMLGLGLIAYSAATSRGASEAFTEFYVLGPGGKAEGYPGVMKVGDGAPVILGVVNREGKDLTYLVSRDVEGEIVPWSRDISLADGERWERRIAIVPRRAGDAQKVEFLLYREGDAEPYRRLHLRIDVERLTEAPPSDTPTPAPEDTPTPAPEDTPTPTPIPSFIIP